MIAAVIFAITIVLPNLFLMGLGFFMKKRGQVSQAFIDQASYFVFNYCLPALLFFSVVDSEVDYAKQITLITAGVVVTFILFLGSEIYAKRFIANSADQGVFVQGIFRSNMAIIGLATVANAYGDIGLSIGAVYMGIVTILFNILAVITLSRVSKSLDDTRLSRSLMVIKKVFTNPLILALLAAFTYKALPLPPVPSVIHHTGDLLAAVALPLALLCAGASINLKAMLSLSGLSMQASIGRIVIAPLLAIAIGLAFGLTGVHMGVLFLMVASPTAAASYVMVKAMGGNDILAANILAFTTVVSLFGMALGAAVLRALGLM
ncbi:MULTISPECIES: AEC family transporter [Psychrobacter]|mgnify:FL=1|jgi:predicted permease|uniref:AEC family transporter n=1 Tax=Psychrobacter TaxID=497 RepID=UPI000426C6DD|nr:MULTISPECIES: AEC family transporter [Psychrobacter]HAM61714.1 AEC family transporter [Psychrobacter sp.]|tara:strand:+ start:1142 stop:2101 length:960 start_codon:yes stop_codon:yes gene_type:complete